VIKHQGFVTEEKKELIKQELKYWYQHSFQRNNRWSRTELNKQIKDYSAQELDKLGACFELLFNTDNQYHNVFIKYLNEYQIQKNLAKLALGTPRLKVNQKTYEEIIHYFGELKRANKLQNTNKQIAKILRLILDPDRPLEETTIIDRLMNKKSYY
jgi:hypothetical protein